MKTNKDAPRLLVKPTAMWGIQSNFRKVFTGQDWIPVCQYPIGWEVEEHEHGVLAKLNKKGEIVEIVRRVFTTWK